MKNIMMIGSALLVLSSTAFATQSRLIALGMNETDNEGSYYISDARNVFLNPAYINIYKDYAIVEWGNAGQFVKPAAAASSDATLSTSVAPKAQGGVFKKYGNFVYGLYLGNESNTSSLLRVAGTSAATSLNGAGGSTSQMLKTADNQVDFFFGGDNGLKWAVNPVFAMGKDEAISGKDSSAAVRLGVIASNWDAHFNVSLNSKSEFNTSVNPLAGGAGVTETVANSFKGKLGFHVGGSYLLDTKNRLFGYVKYYAWDQSDSYTKYAALRGALGASNVGQTGTVKGDFTSYYFGWGRDFDVNNGDKVFTSLAAKKTDINLKFSNKSEVRQLVIPFTVGYEAKANEWLTLRGSLIENLYGNRDNKNINNNAVTTGTQLNSVAQATIAQIYGGTGKATIANSTTVNAGATLNFGQLTVDGLIGATNGSRSGTVSTGTNTGALALDNLQTEVALTYKF
jgi:hypothetical protein